MTKVKRIIAFAMAMIICASFCCYNISAAYEYAYFYGSLVHEKFSNTSAYAELDISDWTWDTDLYALTYATVEDYDYWDGFDNLTVYVSLFTQLQDEFSFYDDSSWEDANFGDIELEAYVSGQNCVDHENDYDIIDFGSDHEVVITIYEPDDMYGDAVYIDINDGPIISIIPG